MIVVTVWGCRKDEKHFNAVREVNGNSGISSKDHSADRYW
jgi:hypothetical protein